MRNNYYAYIERNLTSHSRFTKVTLIFALMLSCIFFILGITNATNYYIDKANGIDSNSGSQSSPWKTIGKANSTLVAEDTLYIKAGTYSETIQPSNSGSPGNYITYARYGTDEVIITKDVTDCETCLNGVTLSNRSYIVVDGLKYGILVEGGYSQNLMQNII